MFFDKLSGYQLKYLALFCMSADHIGVIFHANLPESAYFLLRAAGRLAFPLFAFLLTEGFFHTGNRKKYAARLLLFALLSEAPFDFALGSLNTLPDALTEQNVFFTLFLGFAAMAFLEKYPAKPAYTAAAALLFGCLGELIRADCGAAGIFGILLFYSFGKKSRRRETDSLTSPPLSGVPAPGGTDRGSFLPAPAIFLCLLPLILLLDFPFSIRVFTLAALPPIAAYSGSRGTGRKYFFYLFYPCHLLFLKLLEQITG